MVSIVIIKFPKGYVAELRFEDSSKDISLSANTTKEIEKKIHEHIT